MSKILLSCLLLVGLVGLTSAQPAPKVVIPVARTLSSIPLLELAGTSWAGLALEVPFFDDHPLAMAELLGGKSQALMTGSTLAIKNAQAGGPLVQIATPVWDISGLVTLAPEIQSLKDFAGKTILVPLINGPLDLQLKALLKAQGLTTAVNLEYAEPAQAVALLLQKKAAGAALPEPLASRLVLLNQAHEIFTFAQAWAGLNAGDGRAPAVSLIAKKDFAASHREFFQLLVRALRQKIAEIQAHPSVVAAKYAPVLGLPAAVLERGLAQSRFDLPGSLETQRLFSVYLRLTADPKPLAPDFFFSED